MCGRIAQYSSNSAYAEELGWDISADLAGQDADNGPTYNAAPGTWPRMMHLFHEGRPRIDRVYWGYRPKWAAEKGIPMAINARIEKAASGRYFRHMWKSGRAIVPADGWYEWTGEAGKKQPWHIRLKTRRPMFMAAITNFNPSKEPSEGSGFVIVTAASDAGMVDVHDRRPVVLAPEDARLWLDPALPVEQAEHLARSIALPTEVFEWYQVGKEVNKTGNNEKHLIEPACA
jgi:putative SOS response-associated peptidase YedK